jgi:hypothetical protein
MTPVSIAIALSEGTTLAVIPIILFLVLLATQGVTRLTKNEKVKKLQQSAVIAMAPLAVIFAATVLARIGGVVGR